MTTLLDWVVETPEEGRRADQALAERLDESRSAVQRRMDAGDVTVDGAPVGKAHRLRAGEHVHVRPAQVVTPDPEPEAVGLRWQDEHLAVIAKPAGMVVHAGAGTRGEATLVDALQALGLPLAEAEEPERPGIVHRLDRGTSGLLAVAKTPEALEGLSAALAHHDVERAYSALVEGVPDPPRATIDAPIARSRRRRERFVVDDAGRAAVTHYDVEEAFGECALIRVQLETGRTHQVRVHLSAVGHPVVGDRTYGAARALAERLDLGRPALHAGWLAFDHPVTGERVAVTEPPPADLADALAALRQRDGPERA